MSENKPKIKIGTPYIHNHGPLIVPVEFDFGWKGTVNFPPNTSEEEVLRQINQAYEDMCPKDPKTSNDVIRRLTGRAIHV